ncbi:MAG: glycosyltransferase [Candidatus Sericytochromatia bacterium]|uniref:Glycosyltransferase n=1 Tax=Candidatus Tanganyikabacteria bacterium TaxID=2961651 RepID=A0A937X4M1_9BACT|nr:glycosyltransferase [Candidatus Tanganyikabacteria bacterium]
MLMDWLLLATVYAACATWVVFGLNLLTTRKQIPRLEPRPWDGGEAPLVTIVLPARNEARCLERCLASLTAQDYPRIQILVVDDQSEDDTPRIIGDAAARDSRIEAIGGKALPAGWTGKCWAV